MRKKKLLTAVISLALVISMVLPGTLAVSNGQDSSDAPVETTTAAVDPAPDAGKTGGAADNGGTKAEAGPTETPSQPSEGPSQPSEDPSQPTEDPSQPTEDPSQPTEDPSQPTEDPSQPTEDPAQPSEDPSQPTEDPSQPTEDPAQPTEDPENTEDPEDPEQEAADYTDLFNLFLAAQTYEEFDAIYQELSEEDRTAFAAWLTENGKMEALQAHFSDLYIVDEPQEEEQPIVPFTNVGPLLAAPAARPRMLKAPSNAKDDSGIVLNKTAVYNKEDGSYTITLEAYATGESTTTVKEQPVDIVLVLDVSGSMDDFFGTPTKVYASDLDKGKTYYVETQDGYLAVTWNDSEGSWGYYSTLLIWTSWKSLTPKTSSADSNRGREQFYTAQKKVDALKSAVNGFIDSVATQSPNSKIAIVKFAGNKDDDVGNDTYYDGGWEYNNSQIVKTLTAAGTGAAGLKQAVSALSPAGATQADYGMQHAQTIISGAANDGNKKVVIMFTDGEPTSESTFENHVANAAISASKNIKDNGATVYTIGVFSGANGSPVSSWNGVDETNKYMHLVSSNYKNATSMDITGSSTYPDGGKSYFLSPSNAGELNSIFQSITEEIGGATTTLDETAVIKDIVSPYFTMPADTTKVTVFTEDSNGNTQTWNNRQEFTTGTVEIDSDTSTVSVSGFSFKENWCGNQTKDGNTTFHDGKKLIIQFTVRPKEDFLGGNDVPTNGEDSGIYDKDGTAVKNFEVPEVNVPIKEVTVTAGDKNVYLLGTVTADEIESGATAQVGNVTLGLTKDNYGLESWQTDHVTIDVTYADNAGNKVTDLKDLKEDTTYTVTVTVTPNKTNPESKEGEKATEQKGSGTGNIYVFKPELTYKDSTAYYGETVADDFSGNKVSEVWKHGNTVDTNVNVIMDSVKPTLNITYTPDSTKVYDGKYGKQDVPVKAAVKINDTDVTSDTTFVHQPCGPDCGWTDPTAKGDPAFLIHVKTCTLKITKTGGAADETYVFTVKKDDVEYSEVTIQGNGTETLVELPIGTYTIEEDTGWSWRYTANNGNSAALTAQNHTGTITCTNTKTKDTWLNGFSAVVRNIFKAN